jgi:hypothetical protein
MSRTNPKAPPSNGGSFAPHVAMGYYGAVLYISGRGAGLVLVDEAANTSTSENDTNQLGGVWRKSATIHSAVAGRTILTVVCYPRLVTQTASFEATASVGSTTSGAGPWQSIPTGSERKPRSLKIGNKGSRGNECHYLDCGHCARGDFFGHSVPFGINSLQS